MKKPQKLTQAEKSGNYQAAGGFNFSTAQAAAGQKTPEPVLRDEKTITPPAPAPTQQPEPRPEHAAEAPAPAPAPTVEPQPEPEKENPVAAEPGPASEVTEPKLKVPEPKEVTPQPKSEAVEGEAVEAEAGIPAPAPASEPEPSRQPEPEQVAEPAPKFDDIEPAEGRLNRLRGRLSRSQNAIGQSILGILGAGDLDEDAWEEIEDTLVMADLGSAATVRVVEKLRERIASHGVSSEEEARGLLRSVLIEECQPQMDRSIRALPSEGKPAVILVVGVNGTGKTTTTGKLARVLVAGGHKVVLGAADTFRAAAADQLETWGRRVGAQTIRGAEGADPASVAFDAVAYGVDNGADVVLIDTAGRLHTKVGLMDQLGKVKRVVEKKAHVDEVILVLDATVGQNGLAQARTFSDVVDITGVALTKLDGTAKGGIVFQVQNELGVPVKLVGLGEGADHLAPFEPVSFVDALLGKR